MKVPLHYQSSRFDCGPTSLVNALSYLFEREELPPELVKYVFAVSLDRYHGRDAVGGTSMRAMRFLASWLNDLAEATGFPVEACHLCGDEVSLSSGSRMLSWLRAGGVAVASCWHGVDHYVLVTGVKVDELGAPSWLRIFDPWYETAAEALSAGGMLADASPADIRFVDDAPRSHNRVVRASLFDGPVRGPYSFACDTPKEAMLLRRRS